jgi:hypothetical protein
MKQPGGHAKLVLTGVVLFLFCVGFHSAHAGPGILARRSVEEPDSIVLEAGYDFPIIEVDGYYSYIREEGNDGKYWCLQIPSPDHKEDNFAAAQAVFEGEDYIWKIILTCMDEDDGQITAQVRVAGELVGDSITSDFLDDAWHEFEAVWDSVEIHTGDTIQVETKVDSNDGEEYARGRWTRIRFIPVMPIETTPVVNSAPLSVCRRNDKLQGFSHTCDLSGRVLRGGKRTCTGFGITLVNPGQSRQQIVKR